MQFDPQREISPEISAREPTGTIVFIMVVIGIAFTTLSEGAEPDLALAPTDPTSGQPEAFAPQPTGIWQGKLAKGFVPQSTHSALWLALPSG
jgi:hypothetical protein